MVKVDKADKKKASPAKAGKSDAEKVKKVAKKPAKAKQIKEKKDAKVKKVVKGGLVEAPPAGSPEVGSPKVNKGKSAEELLILRQKKKDKKLENKLKKRAAKKWIAENNGEQTEPGKGQPKKKSKAKKEGADGEENGNESKRVPIKPKQTVFVGNLPTNTKRVQLAKLFNKFGPIVCIRFRTASGKVIFKHKARKESNSLNANVAFDNEESAVKALELNNFEFKGNHIRVTATSEEDIQKDPKRTVVVGNLKYTATDDKLHQIFSSCGEIDYVRTIQNGEKGCNGVGFVCFKNPDAVGLALELKSTVLDDRPINVERYTVHKSGAKAKRDKEEVFMKGPKIPKGSNKFPKKANGNKPTGPGKNKNAGKGGNTPAGKAGKKAAGKPGKKVAGGAKNQKGSDAGEVAKKDGSESKKNKPEFRGVKSTIVKKKGKKVPSAMKKLAKKIAPKGDD